MRRVARINKVEVAEENGKTKLFINDEALHGVTYFKLEKKSPADFAELTLKIDMLSGNDNSG